MYVANKAPKALELQYMHVSNTYAKCNKSINTVELHIRKICFEIVTGFSMFLTVPVEVCRQHIMIYIWTYKPAENNVFCYVVMPALRMFSLLAHGMAPKYYYNKNQ